MEFSAVNRRHPSRETPLGLGAKTDGCFRRLYYIPSLIGRHCNLFPKDLNKFVFEIWLVHSGTKTIKISSTFLHESSVLTRILPWGVAGPPLQKKRGPSRMLEGQRLKVTLGPWRTCKKSFVVPRGTNNLSPHSERYLTWSTYLIQHGGQDVYHRLWFDRDAHADLHSIHVTNEVKGNKSKGFKFFDKRFYSFEQAKCWHVWLTFKLLIPMGKSAWLEACSCALTGTSSWLLVHHLNFFAGIPQGRSLVTTLWESVGQLFITFQAVTNLQHCQGITHELICGTSDLSAIYSIPQQCCRLVKTWN